jgi:hypothetical protein
LLSRKDAEDANADANVNVVVDHIRPPELPANANINVNNNINVNINVDAMVGGEEIVV